ncbi:MAG: NUDIX hydrolase [Cyanobacteria bacterium J06642_2]
MPKPRPPQPSTVLAERLHYRGQKFDFLAQTLQFPNGVTGDREYVIHPGGVVVVPVTADGKFICIWQYRFAIGRYIYEFPAGTVEPDELPAQTARRELAEETGYSAHQWNDLGQFFLAPGYSDEIMYVFLARDLEKLDRPPAGDEDEDIQVLSKSEAELADEILLAPDADAKTIACFLRARHQLHATR